MYGFEKGPFSARNSREEKKDKKIVVEVADGVAHARAVAANSDIPEYLQRFSGDKVAGTEDEKSLVAEEMLESESETDGQRKKKLSYHRSYFTPEPAKRDNLKTIRQNTPDKVERERRGEVREFFDKL